MRASGFSKAAVFLDDFDRKNYQRIAAAHAFRAVREGTEVVLTLQPSLGQPSATRRAYLDVREKKHGLPRSDRFVVLSAHPDRPLACLAFLYDRERDQFDFYTGPLMRWVKSHLGRNGALS